MYAARYGHLNVVDLLIELGVKIDLLAEVFVHMYIRILYHDRIVVSQLVHRMARQLLSWLQRTAMSV